MTHAAIPATAPVTLPRPATVTVAFALQLALVGVLLVMVGASVAEAIHFDGLIDRAARVPGADPAEVAAERSWNIVGESMIAVPALLLAVWFGVTAPWLRRGSNVARILILVGLAAPLLMAVLSCLISGAFGLLFAGLFLGVAPDEGFFEEEPPIEWEESAFFEELVRLDSGGWSVASDVLGATGVLLALLFAVAIGALQLTSASSRYFNPHRSAQRDRYPNPSPQPYPYPYPPAYGYGQSWYAAPVPPQQPPTPPPPAPPPPTQQQPPAG